MKKYNISSSYNTYKKLGGKNLDLSTFVRLNKEFIKYFMDQVWKGLKVKFPANMGSLMIKGRKLKPKFDEEGNIISGLSVDWKSTTDFWKEFPEEGEKKTLIYHTNDHTNGISYKYYWSKKGLRATFKNLWSLKMSRGNKREISKLIKKGATYNYE